MRKVSERGCAILCKPRQQYINRAQSIPDGVEEHWQVPLLGKLPDVLSPEALEQRVKALDSGRNDLQRP
eukprot:CAMPEP_0204580732 /NCGR_PEP_ID=MMETSP0661-20131031/44230_1 /ASSEMBLY_ACC=CAM_ASM_000606 /TAXON_ID=109239 /ORGANISM="Alexandrium margalefi, Strain AMGDE01CS-322" /LENGTH=68 /DNA_ID=CAMNT_0051589841 /DNA_START=40 /DNA_END=242 /DNA_ORIENTATION=+